MSLFELFGKESIEWTITMNIYPTTLELADKFDVKFVDRQGIIWENCRGWHKFQGEPNSLRELAKQLFRQKGTNLNITFRARLQKWNSYWERAEKLADEQWSELVALMRKKNVPNHFIKRESKPFLQPDGEPYEIIIRREYPSVDLPDASDVAVKLIIDKWGAKVTMAIMSYGFSKVDSRFEEVQKQWLSIKEWLK